MRSAGEFPLQQRFAEPALAYVLPLVYYTYMQKLTLSVNEKIVSRAKRYASRHGISVSHMVEVYLDLVTSSPRPVTELPPVLKMLRGAAKGADRVDYQQYLARKF